MRHVLKDAHEVAHYWANQVQSEGRAGNLSFSGTILRSYDAPIAELIPDAKAVLFNSRYIGYSMTTGRHTGWARNALSKTDYLHRFEVPNIGAQAYPKKLKGFSEYDLDSLRYRHTENLKYFVREYLSNCTLAAKARARRATYEADATQVILTADAYCTVFNIPKSVRNKFLKPTALAKAYADKNEADKVAHAARLKREAEWARACKLREEEQAKIDGLTPEERLAAWRDGEFNNHVLPDDGVVRLRIVGETVATSAHAEIPLEHARRVWPILCRAKRNGTHITREMGGGLHFGVYQSFESFNEGNKGVLQVGCHEIAWAEVEGVAKQLGLSCPEGEAV